MNNNSNIGDYFPVTNINFTGYLFVETFSSKLSFQNQLNIFIKQAVHSSNNQSLRRPKYNLKQTTKTRPAIFITVY